MEKKLSLMKWALCTLILPLALVACSEEEGGDKGTPTPNGVFILNQGSYGNNDASLSFYNFDTEEMTDDLLGGTLGETGQDMIAYGSKLYIAVYGSSNITVVDRKTLELIDRVPIFNDKTPREPRYMTTDKGKLYASCHDGTVIRMDTTSFAIEAVCQVGENPEGIAAYNGKLYVANSRGMDFVNGPDNTLSIVDINTFTETEKLTVGVNPYMVGTDGRGNIYLTYQGNWGDIPGGFQRIDANTKEETDVADYPKNLFDINGNTLFFYDVTGDYDNEGNWSSTIKFGTYDLNKHEFGDSFITDGTVLSNPYGIGINPKNKDIYVAEADYTGVGSIFIFGKDGKKKTNKQVGINPCKFVFN